MGSSISPFSNQMFQAVPSWDIADSSPFTMTVPDGAGEAGKCLHPISQYIIALCAQLFLCCTGSDLAIGHQAQQVHENLI